MPDPPTQLILAIDLGTSGPKVGLVSTNGQVLTTTQRPVSILTKPNGGAEQDPQQWWDAITQGVTQVLQHAPNPAEQVRAVGVTSQWSGTIPIDRQGNCLHNAIIWLDTRGAPLMARKMAGFPR